MRFGKLSVVICGICIATVTQAQNNNPDQATLDQYLQEIESLISNNDLEGARDKLAEAATANLRDESLETIHGQLRLLESMNASHAPTFAAATSGLLTDRDELAATDLLDSLRVALENGELDKVRGFSDTSPQIQTLLSAVFENHTALKIDVSPPEADNESNTFLATLEFRELTTKDGNTAFPAEAWKTHRLRVVKSNGSWQKVLW